MNDLIWKMKYFLNNRVLSLLLETFHAERALLDVSVFLIKQADCPRCSLVQILHTREVMINDTDYCTCSIGLIHQRIFEFFVHLVSSRKTCSSFFIYFFLLISVVNHTWLFTSSITFLFIFSSFCLIYLYLLIFRESKEKGDDFISTLSSSMRR